MVYPSDFELKTGFDLIRGMLAKGCLSELGREEVRQMDFSSDPDIVLALLKQTEELRQVLLFEEHFPSQDYYDMTPALGRIRVPGTYLEPSLLSELRLSLLAIRDILTFFNKKKELYPGLFSLCMESAGEGELPEIIRQLTGHIERTVDEHSQVRSSASAELGALRHQIEKTRARIEKQVLQIFRMARQSGWTPEDTGVTVRDGQLVIPLVSAHKRKISGFVRDESATGQTVFIEPAELLELNNEVRELELAEHREIIRILTEIADGIRPNLAVLHQAYLLLGKIDFIRSKASFALQAGGILPAFRDRQEFRWRQAVHPLLFLKHKPLNKPVVPLDIALDHDHRVLVISGPNAGGKSICLKTVGLLQYMIQCGLLPPMKESSECCLFEKIFMDIGDEQSIENDLSTYTSKLLNVKYFIENLQERSLFLIDEMGTGTDPTLGGPIAEASLEEMAATGAMGVVTTHYSNLKLLAGRVHGVVNGAMLFDSKKMRPLYKLKAGSPGSSFAFEIAESIGFPKRVLQNASGKAGRGQLDFDRQLQDLEVERTEVSKKSTELKVADEFLNDLIVKYQKLNSELEKSRKEILAEARSEAARLLQESNKMIEKTIKEIRESQAEKEKTKEARTELKAFKETLSDPPRSEKGTGSQHQKVTWSPDPAATRSPYQSYLDDLNQKLAYFKLTLDLRGKRVDEAYSMLQRYIDDAILLSLPEVRILHGKGNGVLRQVTRDYLQSVSDVKKFQDENPEQGGSGITVVQFK